MPIAIIPIPAFNDNYIWLYQNTDTHSCFVVDPGDANPVLDYLLKHNLKLSSILLTHHHFDHTGGVSTLVEKTQAEVYGPANSPFAQIDHKLIEGDSIELEAVGAKLQILEVPGHTLDHIAYYSNTHLFCGDTLFSGGCGRLFEGTAAQMYDSLQKLKSLPDTTKVYCAHEYTQANLAFAERIEPNNQNLLNYKEKVAKLRNQKQPTLPSCISLEKAINPFLRCDQPEVIKNAEHQSGNKLLKPVDTFAAVREWKDSM